MLLQSVKHQTFYCKNTKKKLFSNPETETFYYLCTKIKEFI